MHPAIAVAVGDVEVPGEPDRQIRRAVEGAAGPRDVDGVLAVVAGVGGRVHRPERHQQLAVRRELAHGVVAVVRAVEHVVRADGDAVSPVGELALAPGAEEPAAVVVDDDRVVAAADQEDPIFGVDRHSRHVAVLVSGRKLLPPLDDLVAQRARLRHCRLLVLPHSPLAPVRRSDYGRNAGPSQGMARVWLASRSGQRGSP